ncbi:molecular chaperone GrpE [Microbacteriaceae bacterium SG_E_30_P1]|uniref:Protein GrpE n=1 Tax=Antiquaquibacter oligotrophicus TaxID=2880260 RepID=A0ABT6KRK3_9MICO|nr:nucleotide exchange factor GrpE [Antiquaquibacter oligotrophicus]MDH6182479.1 molecular chaperone GrpE [Antiquaquibacter oligotrophicus]UDF14551.1 nucleotide exchange factor GrpE [Antiquaquibacter oligotrophicus]
MADNENNDDQRDEPIIRDKRRIDPETGDVREPAEDTDAAASDPSDAPVEEGLSPEDQALLDEAERDLVAEMRNDMLRAQAELVNFRTRVERDRAANREAVIAEVFRSLLPTIDDLARAEAHGDLVEGAPVTLIAQKLRAAFDKYGIKAVGEKGEAFDPAFHEAVVQLPTPGVTENQIADVIEVGYILGDRLLRPAKVAVAVPAE